jgi:hypothetical protein
MIRDPSDGSVRDMGAKCSGSTSVSKTERRGSIPRASATPDTGLRQPTRTDAQERMDRSREWLRQYHKPKDGEKADDLVHRSDESELPSEG